MEAHQREPEPCPAVVTLAGELDAADTAWADEIRAEIDGGCRELVLDLLNVSFIDSSVVRELVLASKQLEPDGWLRVVYTHHLIRRVIDICGLAERLPQFTSTEAALRGTPARHHADADSTSTSALQWESGHDEV